MSATCGGIPMSTLYPAERETTDADIARDAVAELRRAQALFAAAWRVADAAIRDAIGAGYDWTGTEAEDAYDAMQSADDLCGQYADAIEANIAAAADPGPDYDMPDVGGW